MAKRKRDLGADAYADGRDAAEEATPAKPSYARMSPTLERRWEEGIEDARREARGIRERVPAISTRAADDSQGVTPETHPAYFWDEARDGPRPQAFERRRIYPCPHCGRKLANDAGQALATYAKNDVVAYFRCRACGERSKLPIAR
jgi:DNA-directed RNA polymerase subunit RPC12/RpoP